MSQEEYQTPLGGRWAAKEMAVNFGDNKKFQTWRKLWLYLATAEKVCMYVCHVCVCMHVMCVYVCMYASCKHVCIL